MANPKKGATNYTVVQLDGTTGIAGTESVVGLICDNNGDVLICNGLTLPSNGQAGFSKGGIFIDTDVASGTGSTYLNKGTNLACIFSLVTQG
jgi:hypothetical protein